MPHIPRLFTVSLLLVIGASAQAAPAPVRTAFDTAVEEIAGQLMRLNPGLATQAQYFSGAEQDALDRKMIAHDTWGPLDPADRAAYLDVVRRGMERLQGFSSADLTPTQRVSLSMTLWRFR